MIMFCKICNAKFYPRPSHVKRGWGVYCSVYCKSIGTHVPRHKIPCFICKKVVLKTDAQIRHSKSGKYFCGKSCQTKWRNVEYSGEKHAGWKNGDSRYRKILEKSKLSVFCSFCGETDARVLVTHHVDENHKNNDIKNLAWLCHNCHTLVHYDRLERQKFLVVHSKRLPR